MSMLMSLGPMAFGFDVIIVGVVTAIPAFLYGPCSTHQYVQTAHRMSYRETYGEARGPQLILPSLWLSLWNALVQVGFMAGSMTNGWISDRFGRRCSMFLGGIITSAGVAVIFTSDLSDAIDHRRGAFLAGKLVLGFGLSMMLNTATIYTSEIIPAKTRGLSLSFFQFFLVVGQLIAAVVAGDQIKRGMLQISYRTCFASQWALSGAAMIAALVVPESPAWYLRQGKDDAARKSFQRLYNSPNVDNQMASLRQTLEHEKAERQTSKQTSYMECFQGTNWRRTRIMIYAGIVQQFLGITFVANGTYFMIIAGLSPVNAITVLEVASALALGGIVASWYLSNVVGRRRTLLSCTAFLGVVWLSVGIAGCFKSSNTALWYMGIMINLVLFFFNIGAGPVVPIIIGETSSVRLRAKSNAISFFANGFFSWLFNFFVPYMFNADEGNLGGKTGFFFAGMCVLAFAVLWLELPEMKNRTYMQIDEMFEEKLPTRAFRKRHFQEAS